MLKHVVLADAAALATDPHNQDILMAMSYGLHPFAVHETDSSQALPHVLVCMNTARIWRSDAWDLPWKTRTSSAA